MRWRVVSGLPHRLGSCKPWRFLLLTTGANYIEQGDYVVGGALATIGFILLVISNYVYFR
jgi:hypothetical protein